MAKTPKARNVAAVALDLAALAIIVAAGPNGTFAPLAVATPLNENGLIEINPEVTDPTNGNVAVRATPKGIEQMNTPATSAPVAAAKGFAIMSVPAEILNAPKAKRGRSSETYPFDALEVGQGFFVEKTAEREDPAKSMASTVSSAVSRYAVEEKDANGAVVMETVKTKTYEVDAEGKRVKVEGHWVETGEVETVRPKMVRTRVFEIRSTETGAWVIRTA